MSEKSSALVWQNGAARREHELLTEVLAMVKKGKGLDFVTDQLEMRVDALKTVENKYDWSTIVGYGVGFAGGVGLLLGLLADSVRDLGFFIFFLSIFFFWEWVYASWFHPEEVTVHSFQLTHSREFHIMMSLAFGEYFLEWFIFPNSKASWWVMTPAILIVACGQAIRTLSMYTAGRSFNHIIQETKRADHVLVTNGIYTYLRHPSYFGWFWWSVGMALMLANPISVCAFTYASWQFFADRIPHEEETLVRHFGNDYIAYRKRTKTGIPLIA